MTDRNDPLSAALDRAKQLDDRPWNIFVLEEDLATLTLPGGDLIRSVAMVELSPHELRMVFKASQDDVSGIAQAQVAHSIRCINCDEMGGGGRQVSVADGSADKVVSRLHPRVLALLMNAYNTLHENTGDQTRAFLKTRRVVTRG